MGGRSDGGFVRNSSTTPSTVQLIINCRDQAGHVSRDVSCIFGRCSTHFQGNLDRLLEILRGV